MTVQALLFVDLAAESARRSVGQWAQIEEVAADRCRLRLTVDNLDWTALALGSLGAEFEIVNPPGIARAGPRMGESLRSCETRLKRVIAPEGATMAVRRLIQVSAAPR